MRSYNSELATPVRHRRALGDVGQFRAQHADQVPVRVIGREGPPRHGQHIGFGHHRIDVRIEIAWELADADHQLVPRRHGRRAGHRRRKKRQPNESGYSTHYRASTVVFPVPGNGNTGGCDCHPLQRATPRTERESTHREQIIPDIPCWT
jgi:hypothetical protein